MPARRAEFGMAAVLLIAFATTAIFWVPPPADCPIPVPPVVLRAVGDETEVMFLTVYSTYVYSQASPQAPVPALRYELARYDPGDLLSGPGTIIREGRLDSLNRTGDLQYHDMPARGEFSPGNDFFLLLNPPQAPLQLRILGPSGAIAWNMISGCI